MLLSDGDWWLSETETGGRIGLEICTETAGFDRLELGPSEFGCAPPNVEEVEGRDEESSE